VAVCVSDPATLTEAAARYESPGFADHHQLVDVVAPDVVHVCTPHHQHADIAIDCLRAGLGVLLEKPLASPQPGNGELAETVRALRDAGFDGFFCLEPHLGEAHALGGFSGPHLFTQAWEAFTDILKRQEIAYA
jgi:GFO/IDH/MocA oxidoreductase family protein